MTVYPGWNEPVLNETHTKRQHFVPQMYLKRFTRKDGKIRVIDLRESQEHISSLKNVAVQSRFYDTNLNGQSYSAEDWLAEVENRASPILDQLVGEPSKITALTDEQEDSLARFIAALFFRTPLRLQFLSDMTDDAYTKRMQMGMAYLVNNCGIGEDKAIEAYREFKASPIYKELQRKKTNDIVLLMNNLLGEVQGFGNLFRAAPWRLGNVLGPKRLFTSDNPVARALPSYQQSPFPRVFIQYEYYLALSPDVLLQIYPKPLSNGTREKDLPWGGRQCKDFDAWEGEIARDIIGRNAKRFIYDQGSILLDDGQSFA